MTEKRTPIERVVEAEGHISCINEEIHEIVEDVFDKHYEQVDDWGYDWYNEVYWFVLKDKEAKVPEEILAKFADAVGVRAIKLKIPAEGVNEHYMKTPRPKTRYAFARNKGNNTYVDLFE